MQASCIGMGWHHFLVSQQGCTQHSVTGTTMAAPAHQGARSATALALAPKGARRRTAAPSQRHPCGACMREHRSVDMAGHSSPSRC